MFTKSRNILESMFFCAIILLSTTFENWGDLMGTISIESLSYRHDFRVSSFMCAVYVIQNDKSHLSIYWMQNWIAFYCPRFYKPFLNVKKQSHLHWIPHYFRYFHCFMKIYLKYFVFTTHRIKSNQIVNATVFEGSHTHSPTIQCYGSFCLTLLFSLSRFLHFHNM